MVNPQTSRVEGRRAGWISIFPLPAVALAASFAAALFSCAPAPLTSAEEPGLNGEWMGWLENPVNGRLAAVLSLRSEGEGPYAASFSSPMQSQQAFPAASIRRVGKEIVFSLPALSALYRARLVGTDRLEGRFSQGGMTLDLDMERLEEPFVLKRPQDPRPPFPYAVEELSFPGGARDVSLSGTLCLPPAAGLRGGIVMVSGSGPQDRDETLMGHRPFAVLADALARAGWASLRYDDRGTGKSTGDFGAAVTDDFARDALAALESLAARPDFAGRGLPLGLLGHSEGAIVAALLAGGGLGAEAEAGAALPPDVPGFCVLLGGPAFPGEEILRQQGRAIMLASGGTELQVESTARLNAKLYALAREKEGDALIKAATALLRAAGQGKEAAAAQAASLASPWFRRFLDLDPGPFLQKARIPLLALYGSLDLQVLSPENPDKMKELLAGTDSRSRVLVLEGLNHLFQPARRGLPAEYGSIETTVDASALEAILGWLEAWVLE